MAGIAFGAMLQWPKCDVLRCSVHKALHTCQLERAASFQEIGPGIHTSRCFCEKRMLSHGILASTNVFALMWMDERPVALLL